MRGCLAGGDPLTASPLKIQGISCCAQHLFSSLTGALRLLPLPPGWVQDPQRGKCPQPCPLPELEHQATATVGALGAGQRLGGEDWEDSPLNSPRQCHGSGQGFPKCQSPLQRWYIPPAPVMDGQGLALPASWTWWCCVSLRLGEDGATVPCGILARMDSFPNSPRAAQGPGKGWRPVEVTMQPDGLGSVAVLEVPELLLPLPGSRQLVHCHT